MADDHRSKGGNGSQAPPSSGNQRMTGLPTGDLKKTFTSAGTASDALSFTNRDLSGGHEPASTVPTPKNADTKK